MLIKFFRAKWLLDCPPMWVKFVHYTRNVNESDAYFESECVRYGIVIEDDDDNVYFESEEAWTNFLLAFSDEEQ